MTISQRGIIEVAKAVGVGRRTASGPSIAFGSLAVASVALLLLGFHADALSPLVFGTGFSSPAWLVSAVVVTAMWVIVVARIGYRLPIPNSVASGGLLIAGIFAWPATQALFSGSLAGATGTAQTLAGLITLLIVASLVSQTNDLRRLSRVTFLVGATASWMILTAMAMAWPGRSSASQTRSGLPRLQRRA